MQFTLKATSPFNLSTVTNSHGWVQLTPFTKHEDDTGFDYLLELDNGQVVDISVTAVSHLLMFLGHYDAVPVDSWAIKLVSTEWYDGQPIGKKEVDAAFEAWGQWKALAYWFWDWDYLQT